MARPPREGRRRLGRDFWLYFSGQSVSQLGSSSSSLPSSPRRPSPEPGRLQRGLGPALGGDDPGPGVLQAGAGAHLRRGLLHAGGRRGPGRHGAGPGGDPARLGRARLARRAQKAGPLSQMGTGWAARAGTALFSGTADQEGPGAFGARRSAERSWRWPRRSRSILDGPRPSTRNVHGGVLRLGRDGPACRPFRVPTHASTCHFAAVPVPNEGFGPIQQACHLARPVAPEGLEAHRRFVPVAISLVAWSAVGRVSS
jgi:hypothetical protein